MTNVVCVCVCVCVSLPLQRCVGLLDVATGRRLEEVHVRVQARLARDL